MLEVQPYGNREAQAEKTAAALNEFMKRCFNTLDNHPVNTARRQRGERPVNALITNRAGQLMNIESFRNRWGLKGASISSGIMYHGLARFLGMEPVTVHDSASPGSDLARRMITALGMADSFDFIHVHTKAPDVASHTKNPSRKIRVLEELDRGLADIKAEIMDREDILYIITADHSTPSGGRLIHSGEPVPVLMFGRGVRRDYTAQFHETACAQGCLGLLRGPEIMFYVLNYLDRAKLRGLMDTMEDQHYWPGRRKLFRIY